MDDGFFKILIYIVVGLIYIISQIRKAAKKSKEAQENSPPPSHSPRSESRPREKPMTLEEMLKDLQMETPAPAKKKVEPEVIQTEKKQEHMVKEMKAPTLKKVKIEKESPVEFVPVLPEDEEIVAQRKIKEDFLRGQEYKKERVGLKDEHLDHYSLEQKKRNPYGEILKQKESLKKAFILSEILNRKEF